VIIQYLIMNLLRSISITNWIMCKVQIVNFMAVCICLTNSVCMPDTFVMWKGVQCDGDVIQIISRSVPVTSCERVCRLYQDCVGFNTEIIQSDSGPGILCILMRKKTR
jgi:hypothetical protein